MIYQVILGTFFSIISLFNPSKEYTASMFGARSDGRTMNTGSIQKGIDFIHENGGGTLVFYTGRYLTGGIRLRSNVSIKLEDGAVLVGSASPFDYNSSAGEPALISAAGQENISITGHGYIDGNAAALLKNMNEIEKKGLLADSVAVKPALIAFGNCRGINVREIYLWESAGAVQIYKNCDSISISNIIIRSARQSGPANIFTGCKNVRFRYSYIESTGNPLVWKGDPNEIDLEKTIDKNGSAVINLQ